MESPNPDENRHHRTIGGQDFKILRDYHRENGTLFEDPDFPPTWIGQEEVEWLRPSQLCANPEFIVEGTSRFDIRQGEIGDCWLAAGIADLTLHDHLLSFVVPSDNTFTDEYYAGIFHFRLWKFGHWVDVVIDDRLPTRGGKLIVVRSLQENEFWSTLLEKAYAKLLGSYAALDSGHASRAMEVFSGGLVLSYKSKKVPPEDLWQTVLTTYAIPSMMVAETTSVESGRQDGMIGGHAYSITKIAVVNLITPSSEGEERLIRLRNPWGRDEWDGPWSDNSESWAYISDSERKKLELTSQDDGEFWMSFNDFVKILNRLETCILDPSTIPDNSSVAEKRTGQMIAFEGEWVRGVTAGGSADHEDTYPHNPQYIITLDDPDADGMCTVTVALMQKNYRIMNKSDRDPLRITFSIYPLAGAGTLPKPLNRDFFMNQRAVAGSPKYCHKHEVAAYFKLPPGEYCIVPSTYEPNQEGEFLVRVFSGKNINMLEYDVNLQMDDMDLSVVNAKPNDEEQKQDETIREFFEKIAGEKMEIDWMGLKEVLDLALGQETVGPGGFSKEICRSMIAMMDVARTGKLGFIEFKKLFNEIRAWQRAFKLHGKDNSGYLNPFKLRESLKSVGYTLSARILTALSHRNADKDGRFAWDDFITSVVRLKSMMGIFTKKATAEGENKASFKLEDWILSTLYS